MFTKCPHCNTVFRISAEQLTQARGQVRCGICDSSFNSLEHLSESLANFATPRPVTTGANNLIKHAEKIESTAQPIEEDVAIPEPLAEAQHAPSAQEEPEFEEIEIEAQSIDEDLVIPEPLAEAQHSPSAQEEPVSEEIEIEAQPIDEDLVIPEPLAETQHAPSALRETTIEEIDIEARSTEEDLVIPEPSAEALRSPSTREHPVYKDKISKDAPSPLSPLASKRAGVAAKIHPGDNEDSVPIFRILPDQTADTTSSEQMEESQKAAKPLPDQSKDNDLPDLGIIAAEPRRMSASDMTGGWLRTTVWTVTNITLILVLLGQYTYFNRNDLSQYPELRPWLTQFCAIMSCNTPLQRDVSHISLANRVVQSHPNHSNALLISATLINQADFPQPYPFLEIRFSDLNNQLVAGRRFRPSEYLPSDVSLKAGMPPHQPVHITLEVVDPGKEAVSFQFELL